MLEIFECIFSVGIASSKFSILNIELLCKNSEATPTSVEIIGVFDKAHSIIALGPPLFLMQLHKGPDNYIAHSTLLY